MRKISRVKIQEKRQGENHLALLSCSLIHKFHFAESGLNISSGNSDVNDQIAGMQPAVLPSGLHSLQVLPAGFEPASGPSTKDCFIQLSYRGDLSYDNESIIFDNISINNNCVN